MSKYKVQYRKRNEDIMKSNFKDFEDKSDAVKFIKTMENRGYIAELLMNYKFI